MLSTVLGVGFIDTPSGAKPVSESEVTPDTTALT